MYLNYEENISNDLSKRHKKSNNSFKQDFATAQIEVEKYVHSIVVVITSRL